MLVRVRISLLLVVAPLACACTVNPDPIPLIGDVTRTPEDLSIGPMGEAVPGGDAVSWQTADGPSKPDFSDASLDGPSDGGPDHDGGAGDGPTDGGPTDAPDVDANTAGDGRLDSDQDS
jgi:hypothetical protein